MLNQRRFDYFWFLRQVTAIAEISQLDASGKEQLRVSRLGRDVVGSQADFSRDPKFLQARAGKVYFGPVYFRQESEPPAVPEPDPEPVEERSPEKVRALFSAFQAGSQRGREEQENDFAHHMTTGDKGDE